MDAHSIFYSIATCNKHKYVFDLKNLGKHITQRRISFLSNSVTTRPVRLTDYDNLFFNQFIRITKPSNIKAFLGYHLNHHQLKGGNPFVFLDHIKYTHIPGLVNKNKIVHLDILKNFIKQMAEDILLQHQNEKIAFLMKAYEVAVGYAPEGPYSVSLNAINIGKTLGYNHSTVVRIVHELVNDGLASSSLGLDSLYLKPNVRAYLLTINGQQHGNKENTTVIHNNFNVKDSKNVNIASNSNHVDQQNHYTNNDVATAITDVKSNLEKLQQHLDDTSYILLQDKIDTLEALDDIPNKEANTGYQRLVNGIGSIIQAIPANIIANILTPATVELFNTLLPK